MSNLDVALRLRLINQLGGPAKEAKRELEGVGAAAKKLDGAKADKLARDIARTKTEATAAGAALERTAAGAKKLDPAKADRLGRGLSKTKSEALASQRALLQMQRTLQQLDGRHLERMVQGLRKATAASERLARSMKRVREEVREDGRRPPGKPDEAHGPTGFVAGSRKAFGYLGGAYAAYRGAGAAKRSFQDFADLDRRMTRLGITAEATSAQVEAGTARIRDIARQYAVPVEEALKGLEALVAQGKELPEALGMMDAIVKAAQASGASIEDMSNSAGTMMTNLKFTLADLPAAFDRLAYAGKKGQFELKDMAQYFPQLAAAWANVGQKGPDKLADLAAATQIIRKEAGNAERTFNGIRDLLAKINTTEVQNNFKKMGVDLEGGLKKGAAAGRPLFDVLVELTEKALKGDMAKLPKLFGEIDSRTAISALINLKKEFRELRSEIQSGAVGTIDNDIVRVTNDAQASIDRLANSWSAASVAVGKFVAEATPAIKILEGIAGFMDSARELVNGGNNPFTSKEYWQREKEKINATKEVPPVPPKSRFPGRFQSADHARALREHAARVREAEEAHRRLYPPTLRGPASAKPEDRNYSPVPGFRPPQIGHRKASNADPRNYSPVPPVAAAVAESTMARISAAVASESAKAVADSKSAAEAIRAMWNFSVSPQISPRFGGGAGNGGTSPAPSPAAPSGKRAGLGRGSSFQIGAVHINGAGKNGRALAQEFTRELAKLGDSSSALNDTV